MRLFQFEKNHPISDLLTGGESTVYGPDCDGFARFLGKCVDTRRKLELQAPVTWYIQDNIETRFVYDWDYLIDYYFSELRQDRFYMADAFWHRVMLRNGIEAYRIMPIIELPRMLAQAKNDAKFKLIKDTFTSLVNNRSDARYRVHQHLVHNDLLTRCHYSWSNNQNLSSFFNNNRWLGLRDRDYEQFPEFRLPGTIWEPDMGSMDLMHHAVSAVTLCYQTIYHGCGPVYDGKVFKCFLALRPFILIGSSGTLADLRDQGFRTFDGLIDESYDSEPDPFRRMDMILAEIDRLAAIPLPELVNQLRSLKDVLEHNFARCQELRVALEQQDLPSLLMPMCAHVADYDRLLSPNQMLS